MGNSGNSKTKSFLDTIATTSVDDSKNDIAKRCKFNFSYFTIDSKAGQDFQKWEHKHLSELLNKLKEYSKFELSHWENKKLGNYSVFVKYDMFPINTYFTLPKHIPHQAIWSRFHLSNMSRLVGFILPEEYENKEQNNSGFIFDVNTFYIVFLDQNHQFYKITKK